MTLSEKARMAFRPTRVRRAFDRVFKTPGSDAVLAWMADTCGATETTADTDPMTMAVAEGRRQVWLALQDMLRLTEKDVRDLQERVAEYGGSDE